MAANAMQHPGSERTFRFETASRRIVFEFGHSSTHRGDIRAEGLHDALKKVYQRHHEENGPWSAVVFGSEVKIVYTSKEARVAAGESPTHAKDLITVHRLTEHD